MDRALSRTAFLPGFAVGIAGCAAAHEAIHVRVEEPQASKAYGKYRNELARSSIELKMGLAPVPVLNREEWVKSESATKEAKARKIASFAPFLQSNLRTRIPLRFRACLKQNCSPAFWSRPTGCLPPALNAESGDGLSAFDRPPSMVSGFVARQAKRHTINFQIDVVRSNNDTAMYVGVVEAFWPASRFASLRARCAIPKLGMRAIRDGLRQDVREFHNRLT